MEEVISNSEKIGGYIDFRKKSKLHKFIFAYQGKMSRAVIRNLLAMAEKKIDNLVEEAGMKKRIFNLMVHCLDAICTEEDNKEFDSSSIFLISRISDGFTLYTGRYLKTEIAGKLTEIIDSINEMSRDSLRSLHREKLMEDYKKIDGFRLDETILGLIDIALKSKQNVNYLLEPEQNGLQFFSIQVQIK